MLVLPARCWYSFGKVSSFVLRVVLVQFFANFIPLLSLILYREWKTGELKCSYE